jgi:hypothetical protein
MRTKPQMRETLKKMVDLGYDGIELHSIMKLPPAEINAIDGKTRSGEKNRSSSIWTTPRLIASERDNGV